MFAVYASAGNMENPLTSLVVGERPEPAVPEGWVRVKVSHASLNRHDIFTLMGVTAQAKPIVFPMILGNDGAGTLDDGTEVIIYPPNVGPFLRNLVLSGPLFSANVVRKWAMLLGQAIYVLGPLHLKDIFTPIWVGPSTTDSLVTRNRRDDGPLSA